MKDEFLGFYEPTTAEVNKAWESGSFVFDANALLNLYRYSDSTRNDFLSVIEKLKEKLFMPYQVGLEFHSNRISVIEGLTNSYVSLNSSIKELFEKNFKNQLTQFSRHPSIDIASIQKLADDFLKNLNSELENQKKKHPDFITNDNVLNQLTELYKGKVSKLPTKDELKKNYSDGKERYEQLIPPGYKDLDTKKKRGERHIYGDFIIWKAIIAYAIKEKKPIIFVTDDRKEDWWTIENGKTIRPREELIKEFYDLTGIRILIYNADNFLHFAKERKLVELIKETSISEVKEVRKVDESYLQLSDILKNDAIRKSALLFNPNSPSIAEILKLDTFKSSNIYNSPTSSISDYLNSEPFRTAYAAYNPISSSMNEILNSDAFRTIAQYNNSLSASLSDILNNDVLKTNGHFYYPTILDKLKSYNNPITIAAETTSDNKIDSTDTNNTEKNTDGDDNQKHSKGDEESMHK